MRPNRPSTMLTRRDSLRRAALLLGGLIAWPAALMSSAAAQSKMSKAAAGYQNSPNGNQRCGNCAYFDAAQNACNVVQGDISPQAWCQLWRAA